MYSYRATQRKPARSPGRGPRAGVHVAPGARLVRLAAREALQQLVAILFFRFQNFQLLEKLEIFVGIIFRFFPTFPHFWKAHPYRHQIAKCEAPVGAYRQLSAPGKVGKNRRNSWKFYFQLFQLCLIFRISKVGKYFPTKKGMADMVSWIYSEILGADIWTGVTLTDQKCAKRDKTARVLLEPSQMVCTMILWCSAIVLVIEETSGA